MVRAKKLEDLIGSMPKLNLRDIWREHREEVKREDAKWVKFIRRIYKKD